MENWRNMVAFGVLVVAVLFGWPLLTERLFPTANPPSTKVVAGKQVALPDPTVTPVADSPAKMRDRAAVLAETPRVRIDTPRLRGTINLKGARIDDLVLAQYSETIAKNSPPIRLLSPAGAADAYFASFGWTGEGVTLPTADTVWAATGTLLAPGKPVTLRWANGQGQTFLIKLTIDDHYMFTAEQTVLNNGAGAIAAQPYALVSRAGHSRDLSSWTNHTGPIGAFDKGANYDVSFDNLDGKEPGFLAKTFGTTAQAGRNDFKAQGGWIGFVDKYWLTAVIPDQRANVSAAFLTTGPQNYQALFASQSNIVQPGKGVRQVSRLFAGAKEVATLDNYAADLGIAHFDRAIDWGWFIWFEKPIFYLLDWLFRMVGNFGFAIILLTCIVRGLMFPVAQKQFASMASMRVLQPKMKALQEKHKEDKATLQQEMLKLYQAEKVNPLAGCLPIVLQIPIFYALYKVLMLTIEMRHQPFILWIHDLSAPDPATPLNLFGYLAFTPPHMLAIGVLPILLGITMYLQFKLNPAPMDPVQQQVFSIMPWIFMFIMAPFAAGLQLYWAVSNTLTIAQQKWLYSRHPALQQAPAK